MTHARAHRTSGRSVAIFAILIVIAIAAALVWLTGCHDADRPLTALPRPMPIEGALALPDTDSYYITVTDPATGEPLVHVQVRDNPRRSGVEATRASLANAILHVATMLGRDDVAARAMDVRFAFEAASADARLKRPIGGVTCACGSLDCDPTVCPGRVCSGPCGNCFIC